MSSHPTPAEVSPLRKPADPVQLTEGLAQEREEVLRLRDLLIARDAELGAAHGRVLELEARSRYLLGAARRLRSLSPAFVWRIAGRFRKTRS